MGYIDLAWPFIRAISQAWWSSDPLNNVRVADTQR